MSRPTGLVLNNHQTAPSYADSNSQGVKTAYYPGDEVCQSISVNGETSIFSKEGAPLLATYGFKEQCLHLKPFQVDDEDYRLLPLNSKFDCSKMIINPTNVSSSLDNLMDVRYLQGPSRKFVRRIKFIQRGYIDNKYRFRTFEDIRSFTFNNRADIWNYDDQTYRRALDTWIKLTTGTSHGYYESEQGQTTEYNCWHHDRSKDFMENYANSLEVEENEREAGQIGKAGREASANDDVQSTIDRIIETHGMAMPGLRDSSTRHGIQPTAQMAGSQLHAVIGGASGNPQGNGHGYGYEYGSFGDTQEYSASNQSGNNPYNVTSAHGSLPEHNHAIQYHMRHQQGGSWVSPHGSYSAQTFTPQMGEQGEHEDSIEENHVTRSINEMLDRFS
ncbi:hypothetical protein V865_007055 [Kwoniella europaea PYCC6329]|uniref:Uncharacterized protein n=1 Tax=Kwoniella europaea PYCC6329 TaxID=1423913 RepID=A0AAX4KTP3_9TREE